MAPPARVGPQGRGGDGRGERALAPAHPRAVRQLAGMTPDLAADPRAVSVTKRPVPVTARFAPTRRASARRGRGRSLTARATRSCEGVEGEVWPVDRAKFEASYDPVPPARMGQDGVYRKKPLRVLAVRLDAPLTVQVGERRDALRGEAGDWLLQYGPGDYGVVGILRVREDLRAGLTSPARRVVDRYGRRGGAGPPTGTVARPLRPPPMRVQARRPERCGRGEAPRRSHPHRRREGTSMAPDVALEPIERRASTSCAPCSSPSEGDLAAPMSACRTTARFDAAGAHPGRSAELDDLAAFPSRPRTTCGRIIRSACSPCRWRRSSASMPRAARRASRPWSAIPRGTSTPGRT